MMLVTRRRRIKALCFNYRLASTTCGAFAGGSLESRVAACADLANDSDEPWVIWCELNDESSALTQAIPDAVEVQRIRQHRPQDGSSGIVLERPDTAC